MSTVILDTITGKSTATTITIGSTPVVSASANSMTIRGEGSNQTSIQQGLAKSWVNFDGTATGATARDSLNVSTMTDRGTGKFTITFATVMGNTNYNSVASATVGGADNYNRMAGAASNATNFSYLNTFADPAELYDAAYTSATFHGDLA